ncbi:helix-turn-helix domain-containing protein [Streptomyces asoensis]
MALVMTTASVPESERPAYWREAVGRALAPMAVTVRHGGPFEGRVCTERLGHLRITTIEADAQRVSRTAAHLAGTTAAPAPAADHVVVGLQTAGTATLLQDGRRALVEEGDLMVYDTGRPYSLDFLAPLTASVPPCAPAVAGRLAAGVVDLVATLVDERIRGDVTPAASQGEHLVLRVRDHIDRHLADPGLSPGSVAAAHHISVRYLHRLFEGEGVTVSRLIQQRRLERCARELRRAAASAPPVSAVAQRWGFANPAHFSRVFRAAYGLSPREWREARDELVPAG